MATIHFKPAPASWADLISPHALTALFRRNFAGVGGRGIDRISAEAFAARLPAEVDVLARKALDASYSFTPYLERLVLKGRGKVPRVLSVPAIRDRLLMHQLKEYLHTTVPHATERTLPNEYVRRLKRTLSGLDPDGLTVIRADIRAFYDTIPHDDLFKRLAPLVGQPSVLTLLRKAVKTPTVPSGFHRPKKGWPRNTRGVPQGLAISNALANVYLRSLDEELTRGTALYLRYVDDILIVVHAHEVDAAEATLKASLFALGLELNDEKWHVGPLSQPFDYLGYRFYWPTVSVRKSTVEKFLRGVASMVSDYYHRSLTGRFPRWLRPTERQTAFLDEVNEKITGAVSEVRKYGWLFYFSEITDLNLLHAMDSSIAEMFLRIAEFGAKRPPSLKRLSRAYFEARHSPDRGYIHNYNRLTTTRDQLDFLVRRGQLDPTEVDRLTVEEVTREYLRYRARRLQLLELDTGRIS